MRIVELFNQHKTNNNHQYSKNDNTSSLYLPFTKCFGIKENSSLTKITKGCSFCGVTTPYHGFWKNEKLICSFKSPFLCSYDRSNVPEPILFPCDLKQTSYKNIPSTGEYDNDISVNPINDFGINIAASAIATAIVYPTDLIKTRLQNQMRREIYGGGIDCFKKVIRREGFFALYRGLGVKSLAVVSRSFAMVLFHSIIPQNNQPITILHAVFSGATAGASYVLLNNPFEIVKIRLQLVGEVTGRKKISAIRIVRHLGFFGLFKGSTAMLLRDVPYGIIYFNIYAILNNLYADENEKVSPVVQYWSAIIASIPTAILVTPADVIKTRIMAVKKPGRKLYSGVICATKRIYREEGFQAFWSGALARVIRTAPQTGLSLLIYEVLRTY